MRTSLIEQYIQSSATSIYDENSRHKWIQAMRTVGIDEQTILQVYEHRYPNEFKEACDETN